MKGGGLRFGLGGLASDVGFHGSITTTNSDFEYLVYMRPNLAKFSMAWPNLASLEAT